ELPTETPSGRFSEVHSPRRLPKAIPATLRPEVTCPRLSPFVSDPSAALSRSPNRAIPPRAALEAWASREAVREALARLGLSFDHLAASNNWVVAGSRSVT